MLMPMFIVDGGEEGKARMEGGGHDKEVASSKFNMRIQKSIPYYWPKWPKSIPYVWPKRLKNLTLWGGTYLYSPYRGVPPRVPRGLISAWQVSRFPSTILRSSRVGNENMLAKRNTAVVKAVITFLQVFLIQCFSLSKSRRQLQHESYQKQHTQS